MLSFPQDGWTSFSLGSDVFSLSFLTPVSNEWLDSAIYGLGNMVPFTVHGICEPGRMLCTVSYWNCHIIFEYEDDRELDSNNSGWSTSHVSMIDFCKMLCKDIGENVDEWADWDEYGEDIDEDKHKEAVNALEEKLSRLRQLIEKTQSEFEQPTYLM